MPNRNLHTRYEHSGTLPSAVTETSDNSVSLEIYMFFNFHTQIYKTTLEKRDVKRHTVGELLFYANRL